MKAKREAYESQIDSAIRKVLPLLDGLSSAIVLLDGRGAVTAANQAAKNLFGGAEAPWLASVGALRTRVERRERAELLWTSPGHGCCRVRLIPRGAYLLVEAVEIAEQRRRERQRRAAEHDQQIRQAEHEQLLVAYELATTASEEARYEMEEKRNMIEQWFSSNLEFLQ
ncbi:MAG: hypothetical protein ACRD1C_04665 [Terriglobales bacterium]